METEPIPPPTDQKAVSDAPAAGPSLPPGTVCWVLSEGHAGMENQALGVAEALGLDPVVKRLWPRAPWKWLPPRLWVLGTKSPGPKGDPLAPPWPDIVISCGKRAAAAALAVKKASMGRTFAVHIQQPPLPARAFDLLIVPAHDSLRGDNVLVTDLAVHRVTREKLAAARARFADSVADVPVPRVAVLIGGSNNRYRMTPEITRALAEKLAALAQQHGAGLLVTPSRRTGAENEAILRETLAPLGPRAQVWDGTGENPYFAFLALADALVVTCDSVSMTSEAVSTGKPVYVLDLEGSSKRIEAFHENLRARGFTRRFDEIRGDDLAGWNSAPPDDTARAAAEIARRFAARR